MKINVPKVAVLMSTYNGERYLQEQIDSVMNQKGVDIDLYIRDDGSKDRTIEIIKKNKRDNIYLEEGINVGVGNSFMSLVYTVSDDYDYYAFCDQDDIWLEEKILRAVQVLCESGKVIYCSNQTIVDSKGKVREIRYLKPIQLDLINEIQENKVTGCTIVFTRELKKIVCDEKRRPGNDFMKQQIHDIWFALVGCAINSIIYDQESYIYYRQHENNVIGIKKETVKEKIKKWRRKLANKELRNSRSKRAKEIYTKFGDCFSNKLVKASAYPENIRNRIIIIKNYSYFKEHNNIIEFLLFVVLGQF